MCNRQHVEAGLVNQTDKGNLVNKNVVDTQVDIFVTRNALRLIGNNNSKLCSCDAIAIICLCKNYTLVKFQLLRRISLVKFMTWRFASNHFRYKIKFIKCPISCFKQNLFLFVSFHFS